MSTAILRGRRNDVDHAIHEWLKSTELAGDTDAALRLSRAVKPADHGFPKRVPLDLLSCTDFEADLIIGLLEAGQVPTPEAVVGAKTCPPWMNCPEMQHEKRREIAQIKATIRASSDWLGEASSSATAEHWATHGIGPTWQEVWRAYAVREWWIFELGEVPDYHLARKPMFAAMARLGWLAYGRAPRSLCTGRLFHTRDHGDQVSKVSPATIGFLVARQIGIYRRAHDGFSPTWSELTETTLDAKGVPVFIDAADGRAQQRWLETQGWIRLEGDQLRRGDRAKAETRRRATLRKRAVAPAM